MNGPIFQIQLPPGCSEELLAKLLQHGLNAGARMNADWVLEEWAAGRDPKCCAKCNGTRYVPGGTGSTLTAQMSPLVFQRRAASCGSIAMCHTGHKIAEAVMGRLPPEFNTREPIAWDDACRRFQVCFKGKPTMQDGAPYFHAICDDDGKILDPTIGMKR